MRVAQFMVTVVDREDGDDKLDIQTDLVSGDIDLMVEIIAMVVSGGEDFEIKDPTSEAEFWSTSE